MAKNQAVRVNVKGKEDKDLFDIPGAQEEKSSPGDILEEELGKAEASADVDEIAADARKFAKIWVEKSSNKETGEMWVEWFETAKIEIQEEKVQDIRRLAEQLGFELVRANEKRAGKRQQRSDAGKPRGARTDVAKMSLSSASQSDVFYAVPEGKNNAETAKEIYKRLGNAGIAKESVYVAIRTFCENGVIDTPNPGSRAGKMYYRAAGSTFSNPSPESSGEAGTS